MVGFSKLQKLLDLDSKGLKGSADTHTHTIESSTKHSRSIFSS